MEGLVSLLGTDNIFKYLLSAGIVLVALAIIYPLQEANKIELEINAHNKEVALLNYQIDDLKRRAEKLESSINQSKQKLQVEKDSTLASDLLAEYDELRLETANATVKQVQLDFLKIKINILSKQYREFMKYRNWLLYPGIIFIVSGLIGWIWLTRKTIKEKTD